MSEKEKAKEIIKSYLQNSFYGKCLIEYLETLADYEHLQLTVGKTYQTRNEKEVFIFAFLPAFSFPYIGYEISKNKTTPILLSFKEDGRFMQDLESKYDLMCEVKNVNV